MKITQELLNDIKTAQDWMYGIGVDVEIPGGIEDVTEEEDGG
jgi:hypothetical protein